MKYHFMLVIFNEQINKISQLIYNNNVFFSHMNTNVLSSSKLTL